MASSRAMVVALILLAGCGLEFVSGPASTGGETTSGTQGSEATQATGGTTTQSAGGIGGAGASGGAAGPGGGGVAGSAGGTGACYNCAEAFEGASYVPVALVCGPDKVAYQELRNCLCGVVGCATPCMSFCNQSSGADETCLSCVDGADSCDGVGTACGVDVFSQ